MQLSKKYIILYLALFLALLLLFVLDLSLGSSEASFKDLLFSLRGYAIKSTDNFVLFQVRMPRAVTAIVVGAGLSLGGLLLQTLFNNPLAGPYVLGISSGAGLGVAIYLMVAASFVASYPLLAAGGQVTAALLGTSLVFILVLVFSWRMSDTVSLLIIGIMIGAFTTSIVGILQFFASPELVKRFVIWSLGSLGSTTWMHLSIILPVFFISVIASVFVVKPLDALLMGDVHARVTGVNVNKIRVVMIIISSILVGTITAFAGPISFIGMTVPHMVRLMIGRVSFKLVLPGVLLVGPIVLLICDIISQLPGRATTLPINGVTALFGAPVVILLIIRSRRLKSSL